MFISRLVKDQVNQGRSLTDFAVLFRAGYHSFELEMELTRQGIPFVKYGGFKFMESAHIKDFLAHLRVVVNVDDAISWGRILRLIPKIGQAKSNAIMKWLRTHQIPPGKVAEWPDAGKDNKDLKKLSRLLATLSSTDMGPQEAVKRAIKYYTPILEQKFDDYPRRQRELDQLVSMASRYKKLRSFLDDLVLEPPSSSADINLGEKVDSLTLSTVHSAKGLEWPTVLIIWVLEGRFPPARSQLNPGALEEERRLMYVAATRAKNELIICYPSREAAQPWSGYGSAMGGSRGRLSSFIDALPQEVMSYERVGSLGDISSYKEPFRRSSDTLGPLGKDRTKPSGLAPGDRVSHPAFGAGVVSKLVKGEKVEVLFRNYGRKLLHLAYTSLEKV
jgi:DNA helicase-2/ATP-dependent DNA helicase PcrA